MTALALAAAPLGDVLHRLDDSWQPFTTNNMLVLGISGAGKTTLLHRILGQLCRSERVVILLPKASPDPAWLAGPHPPAVRRSRLPARFGQRPDGGGPGGRWYLRLAAADPRQAERDFRADLELVLSEGHAIVVLDDVRTMARAYRLDTQHALGISDLLCNGRSLGVSTITASQTAGYVPARDQMSASLVGHLGDLNAATAAAPLISQRGRDWHDTLAATQRYQWIYHDKQLGDAGPCRLSVPRL